MTDFFPEPLPILTDKQEKMARYGICPSCETRALTESGAGEGLRFLGCIKCHSITVLAARADDRHLVLLPGRRTGRAYVAQQVAIVMRLRLKDRRNPDRVTADRNQVGNGLRWADALALEQINAGYCAEGDRCVCGGDLPRVRAGCANWRKGGAA